MAYMRTLGSISSICTCTHTHRYAMAFPETVESSELSLVRQWLLDDPSENKAPTRFPSSNEMLKLMVRDCTARRTTLNTAHFYRTGTNSWKSCEADTQTI